MHTERLRHGVAAIAAVIVVAGVLIWLNDLSPGLTTGVWMRDTLALAGEGSSEYEAFAGTWLVIRGLLGIYLTGLVLSVAGIMGLSLLPVGGDSE